MNNILILTVGGSHSPILRSVEQNRPSFVYFLCSGDSGKTKGSYTQVTGEGMVLKSRFDLDKPDLPNIATLAQLKPDQFDVVVIEHLDNLNDCYLFSMKLIERLHREQPDSTLIADYTGGTKSMTAGLAAAALDDGRCEIKLVTGIRQDLRQVTDQTEFVRPVRVWDAQVHRRMQAARSLIARFDYAGAAEVLEEAAGRFASDETIDALQRWLSLCRAFDAWDKFDHATARELLTPFRGVSDGYKAFLSLLLGDKGHGFELTEDLVLNADRRATQGRYDDAVGRLYRALELTAQTWLKLRYGIDTSHVNLDLVPEALREGLKEKRNGQGMVELALLAAWGLISAMPDDPLGPLFIDQRSTVMDRFLKVRNYSLFAHGMNPIRRQEYEGSASVAVHLITRAMELAILALGKKGSVRLQQLPTQWD